MASTMSYSVRFARHLARRQQNIEEERNRAINLARAQQEQAALIEYKKNLALKARLLNLDYKIVDAPLCSNVSFANATACISQDLPQTSTVPSEKILDYNVPAPTR